MLEELKEHQNWTLFKIEERHTKSGVSQAKVPINPRTGAFAKANDPGTWGTYQDVRDNWGKWGTYGAGFALTEEVGIVGIDVDDCIRDGSPLYWAHVITQKFRSYTDVSYSGKGFHILVKGTIPRSFNRPPVEAYSSGRIFGITGKMLDDKLPHHIVPNQEALDWLVDVYGPKEKAAVSTANNTYTYNEVRDMLSCIPPDGHSYNLWINLLMAVYSQFPNEQWFDLVNGWTQFKDGESETIFRSFDQNFQGKVSIGTVIHVARQYGYTLPVYRQIVENAYWNGYRKGFLDGLVSSQSERTIMGLKPGMVDILGWGFKPQEVDQETGEIFSETLAIPFRNGDDLFNIQYRSQDGIHYETDQGGLCVINPDVDGPVLCVQDPLDAVSVWAQNILPNYRIAGSTAPDYGISRRIARDVWGNVTVLTWPGRDAKGLGAFGPPIRLPVHPATMDREWIESVLRGNIKK